MEVIDHGLYARSFTDVYDEWYGDLDDPVHLVEALTNRCPPASTIVELGSGTGRLASPLDAAGFAVVAIDISPAMLAQAPPGPCSVTSDMTALGLRSGFAHAVVIAYNTLFNAPSVAGQQHCFHEAARVLAPTGVLAIEAFVAPTDAGNDFGVTTRAHPTEANHTVSIVTGPHPSQPDVIVGSHVESGNRRTCRPWQLLYQTPAQLDACAQRAGLVLDARHGSWAGARFDDMCDRHISWYRPR